MSTHLMQGDCLERMKEIPDGSVDMVLTDPPYGTAGGMGKGEERYKRLAESSWDLTIETVEMFEQCNRVLRTNGALILFAQEPYTSRLITQAHGNLPFSYRMVWLKDHFANCLVANKAPVSYTEDVCVFFKKHTKHDFEGFHPLRPYAQKVIEYIAINKKRIFKDMKHQGADHFMRYNSTQFSLCTEKTYNDMISLYHIDLMPEFRSFLDLKKVNAEYRSELIKKMLKASPKVFNLPTGNKYKSNVLEYRKDYGGLHPTQKPIALMEDLIRTYTHEGDTVLDFTMGSGTTGVACKNLGRDFIGIELDQGYYDIAQQRIGEA